MICRSLTLSSAQVSKNGSQKSSQFLAIFDILQLWHKIPFRCRLCVVCEAQLCFKEPGDTCRRYFPFPSSWDPATTPHPPFSLHTRKPKEPLKGSTFTAASPFLLRSKRTVFFFNSVHPSNLKLFMKHSSRKTIDKLILGQSIVTRNSENL